MTSLAGRQFSRPSNPLMKIEMPFPRPVRLPTGRTRSRCKPWAGNTGPRAAPSGTPVSLTLSCVCCAQGGWRATHTPECGDLACGNMLASVSVPCGSFRNHDGRGNRHPVGPPKF